MKIFYLCSWEVHNGERQGVVKIFSNSTATENMTLIINAVPKEYILEKNQIKEDYKEMGKVISIRETKIENIKTIEAIIESTQERAVGKFKIKALLYSFIYKNCLVGISFSCQGFDRSVVNKKFLNEEGLFKLLVSRTILLDKLE